jgi:hypothetical protein
MMERIEKKSPTDETTTSHVQANTMAACPQTEASDHFGKIIATGNTGTNETNISFASFLSERPNPVNLASTDFP